MNERSPHTPGAPRVLVFEDIHDGHHLAYVRHILDALLARGARPVLATTSATALSDEFAALVSPLREHIELSLFEPVTASRLAARHAGRALQLLDQIRRTRPDHTIVPYIDGMAFVLPAMTPLGWLSRWRRGGLDALVMRVTPGTSWRDRARHRLLHALVRTRLVDRLHVIDELSHETLLREASPAVAQRLCLTPDPVLDEVPLIDAERARRELHLPLDRRLVLCIGLLSPRKGVDRLIEAAADPAFPEQTTLVLAGAMTNDIRSALDQPAVRTAIDEQRIVVHPGFVAPDDFGKYFAAADAVTALYIGHHGSSGIVIQAAQAARPVLAIDTGWIGRVVDQHRLGVTIDPSAPGAVCDGLRSLLDGQLDLPDLEGCQRLLAPRTLDAFTASLLQAIPFAAARVDTTDRQTDE